MSRRKDPAAGDFLYCWHDTGPTVVQVVRVNRKTITVRNENGELVRANPARFRPWTEPGKYGVLTVPPPPWEMERERLCAQLKHTEDARDYFRLWHPGGSK